jgi:outer membrane protein TolC
VHPVNSDVAENGKLEQVLSNPGFVRLLRISRRFLAQQKEAAAEAQRGVEIVTNRYQLGADPSLQVVSAETIALENERNEVDILRRRMDARVLLIKALGGGWEVSKLPQISSMH